jgi:hypothetical protein
MAETNERLQRRVLDGSFQPERDARLLDGELLPEDPPFPDAERRLLWRKLRAAQLAYQRACDIVDDDESLELWRDWRAGEFSRAVKQLHGHRGDSCSRP